MIKAAAYPGASPRPHAFRSEQKMADVAVKTEYHDDPRGLDPFSGDDDLRDPATELEVHTMAVALPGHHRDLVYLARTSA